MPQGIGSAHAVRPFWGRVTLIESPLDEEETASGLIVPRSAMASASDDPSARRGIVQAVEFDIWDESHPAKRTAERLEPGTIVYFRSATRIQGDVLAVEFADILAFEPSDSFEA